jgi:hypothetical protein
MQVPGDDPSHRDWIEIPEVDSNRLVHLVRQAWRCTPDEVVEPYDTPLNSMGFAEII